MKSNFLQHVLPLATSCFLFLKFTGCGITDETPYSFIGTFKPEAIDLIFLRMVKLKQVLPLFVMTKTGMLMRSSWRQNLVVFTCIAYRLPLKNRCNYHVLSPEFSPTLLL